MGCKTTIAENWDSLSSTVLLASLPEISYSYKAKGTKGSGTDQNLKHVGLLCKGKQKDLQLFPVEQ